MRLKGTFESQPLIVKLLIFFGLCLLSLGIFSMGGYFLASALYDINLFTNPELLTHYNTPGVINAMKIVQTFSAIGLFIIPAIVAAWLFSSNLRQYLFLDRKPALKSIILVVIILFACVPVINWLVYINQQMAFPQFLTGLESWMKDAEAQATKLTEAFLLTSSWRGLLFNLFVIALIPAIGEELMFRGVLLRLLNDTIKNRHAAIIITSILFSALHMQFYGFIPRMMLGVLMGYFLIWSSSLWLPVIGHFINNATAVILAFIANRNNLPFNQDTIGAKPGDGWILFISIMITGICLYFLFRSNFNDSKKSLNPEY